MKRLFPLFILFSVLILPALTGCPQDSGGGAPDDNQEDGTLPDGSPGSIPNGNLGDGPLVIKGKLYVDTGDYPMVAYTPYTAPGVVEMYSGNETLGEVELINGEFEVSIDKPADLSRPTFGYMTWKNPTADPADVQTGGISFRLKDTDMGIFKEEKKFSWDQAGSMEVIGSVVYWYADKDAVITLGENEIPAENDNGVTRYYNKAELKLTKGWNALYSEEKRSRSSSLLSMSMSVSVGNPDLKWTFYQYQ
jgi:hypothetical protein